MIKFIVKLFVLLIIAGIVLWFVGLLESNEALKNDIIRLHIIANSDSDADQAEKLNVRDGVLAYIEEEISKLPSKEEAEAYIRTKIVDIEKLANEILSENGSEHIATVKLGLKEFGKRVYDTFSLPSGVYEALQIEIGEAEGRNWWCVVFPGLCMPNADAEFSDIAVSAGFDQETVETISNAGSYKIRFFVLDFIGKIENFLFNH